MPDAAPHYVIDGPLTTFFGGQRASDPVTGETELPFETFFEPYGDRVACLLADRLAQVGLDWQLVRAVAESHEGGPERPAIDGASTFTSQLVPKYSADPGMTT